MSVDYIIKSGESLSMIAARNKIDLDQILSINPDIDDPNVVFAGQSISLPLTRKSSRNVGTNNASEQSVGQSEVYLGPKLPDDDIVSINKNHSIFMCPESDVPILQRTPVLNDNCPGVDEVCTVLSVDAYDEESDSKSMAFERCLGSSRILEIVPPVGGSDKIMLRQLNFGCSDPVKWTVATATSTECYEGELAVINVEPAMLRHLAISPGARWAMKALPKIYRVRSSKDCGVSGENITIKVYPSEICKITLQPETLHFYKVVEDGVNTLIKLFIGDNLKVSLLKGTLSIEGQWKEYSDYRAFYSYDIAVGFDPLIELKLKIGLVDALKCFSVPAKAADWVKKYTGDLLYVSIAGSVALTANMTRVAPEEYSKWSANGKGAIMVAIGAEIGDGNVISVFAEGETGLSIVTKLERVEPDDKPLKIDFLFEGLRGKFGVELYDGWLKIEESYQLVDAKPLISNHSVDLLDRLTA